MLVLRGFILFHFLIISLIAAFRTHPVHTQGVQYSLSSISVKFTYLNCQVFFISSETKVRIFFLIP